MFTETDSSTPADPRTSLNELVDRSGDLKGELLAFAESPRFAKQFRAQLNDAADDCGGMDEAAVVTALDHFLLQHRLRDGSTVVEQFVARRKPPLSDDERAMLLGWRTVVEGCFEVRRFDGPAVVLHNLIDDLTYRVHSNMGPEAFAALRDGMFVIGRIVPVHPARAEWLVSGYLSTFFETDRRQIAQAALQTLTAHPAGMARNTDLVRRSWELQAEDRAAFVDLCGTDLVILAPEAAQETLREHYRRRKAQTADGDKARGPSPEMLGRLPESLLAADSVGLIYDEVEGLNYYGDFGRLDALFADPDLVRDLAHITLLRGYLRDESVSPMAIRRLVQRHPHNADQVFRALLRKPDFSWQRDGEQLLRDRKRDYADHEPVPSISCIGERLRTLLDLNR